MVEEEEVEGLGWCWDEVDQEGRYLELGEVP